MDNSNKNVLRLALSAIIAALYILINYLQEFILPASTSMPVQIRMAELLLVLALFTPAAITGLTLGTLISNIINIGVLPLDILFGSVATLIAALLVYHFRNVKVFTLPFLSMIMPVIINGIIIGLELELFFIKGPFHFTSFLIQAGMVAIGEIFPCLIFGLPFFKLLEKLNVFKNINRI